MRLVKTGRRYSMPDNTFLLEPKLLEEIVSRYFADDFTIELVNYEYNATYKVHLVKGEDFALRVNINSMRNLANLEAEVAWIRFLSSQADLKVPHVIENRDGDFHVSVKQEGTDRMLHCLVYSWIEGEDLDDDPTEDQVRAMGVAMARMHLVAPRFELPHGASLPTFDDPLWWTEDFLLSEKSVLDASAKDLISRALVSIKEGVAKFYLNATPMIIHADMHGGNVLWKQDHLSVIDFDDCGFGLPIQDLATALYYFDTPEQDSAFKEGYNSIAPLPECSEREMKMFFLQRRIVLLNYLYETSNLELKSMIPEYQEETLRRIKNFLG